MSRHCYRCGAPLGRRECLYESLLCVDCERKLTAYQGKLPDPNHVVRAGIGMTRQAEMKLSTAGYKN